MARRRAGEPWYAEAAAALARVQAGTGDERGLVGDLAVHPRSLGRRHPARYDAWMDERRDEAKATARSVPTAPSTRVATRAALAVLDVPVSGAGRCGGHRQPTARSMAEVGGRLPAARSSSCMEGAGHFPWVDDAERFVALVAPFVGSA